MALLITLLCITTVQIPGLIIRYIPFSRSLSSEKKKKLWLYYLIGFLLQHVVVYLILRGRYENITPLTYKRLLFLLSTIYVFINVMVIKGSIYKHIFVYGMQGGYSLFVHSIIALFVGSISGSIPLYQQFATQSLGYTVLAILCFIPLWKKVRDSIIFNSTITNDYYWNVIWMIPALAIYSDAMITMNHSWINSMPQIISRIMTALSLIISWRWITLDFESLENMLYLKSLNKVLHLQTEGIVSQAHLLTESEKHIKICKHDMRHNLAMLSALIQKNETEEALHYIQTLDANMKTGSPIVYCHNVIINSAILVYMSKTNDKNIVVHTELNIPENMPWNSNDIAILIANAFENAITATSKQKSDAREIYLSTNYHENKLAIVIKNTFEGELLMGNNGFPTTTEADHGIGIQSILSIAKKYDAAASCTYNDGWVVMSFLFSAPTSL